MRKKEKSDNLKIFFDTEFTGLHKNTTLISIGLISEDGRTFYAEFLDYNKNQCDKWIEENVINHLLHPVPRDRESNYYVATRLYGNIGDIYKGFNLEVNGTTSQISFDIKAWLAQFDNVQFVSDVCHYDFVLLIDLITGGRTALQLPTHISTVCHELNNDIARHYGISDFEAFDKLREEIVMELCRAPVEGKKHNSLYDAKVIKAIYEELNNI